MPRKPEVTKKYSSLFNIDKVNLPKFWMLIFKLIQIMYSYDLGGFDIKSKKKKLITKCLSVMKSCIISVFASLILHRYKNETFTNWYFIIMLQYMCTCITFAYFDRGMSFSDFQKILLKFDCALRISKYSKSLYIKMLFYLSGCIILRVCFIIVYCFYFDIYCVHPIVVRVVVISVYISFDVILLMYFFIFYTTRWRLRKIVSVLENTSTSVMYLQYLYKSLIDSIETVKRAFDSVYVLSLLFNGTGVMLSLYSILKAFIRNSFADVLPGLAVGCISNLQSIVVTFSPPLCAGMLSLEAESIKIVLHNRLLYETDKNTYSDIKRFISYVDARPFKLRACRIIPLDSSLPVIALNLCVTYLIVLVQFTHLY